MSLDLLGMAEINHLMRDEQSEVTNEDKKED